MVAKGIVAVLVTGVLTFGGAAHAGDWSSKWSSWQTTQASKSALRMEIRNRVLSRVANRREEVIDRVCTNLRRNPNFDRIQNAPSKQYAEFCETSVSP